MPFYKRDGDELHCAQNFVMNSEIELRAEFHADYIYPVDGWYWFDTLDGALVGMQPTPLSVTMRQARLALFGAGLLSSVETAIGNLPEPSKTAALIEWEYSNDVQRYNGFVEALGPILGWSPAQIDALFSTAATL